MCTLRKLFASAIICMSICDPVVGGEFPGWDSDDHTWVFQSYYDPHPELWCASQLHETNETNAPGTPKAELLTFCLRRSL